MNRDARSRWGSRGPILAALFACVSAVLATVIFAATRQDCGRVPAGLAGALLLLLPLTQEYGHMVMTELPQALWCTLAILQFGRFLDEFGAVVTFVLKDRPHRQ